MCGRNYTNSSSFDYTYKKPATKKEQVTADTNNNIFKILPGIIMVVISFIIMLFDSDIGWMLMAVSFIVLGISGAVMSFQNSNKNK